MKQELTGNIKKHKCVTLLGAPGDTAPGGTPPPLATLIEWASAQAGINHLQLVFTEHA